MTTARPKSLFDALKHLVVEGVHAPVAAPTAAPDAFAGKIVVSISRKGRGGRTVTIVAGLRGGDALLEQHCREIKQALGCGASVETGAIVISGNLTDRVKAWLEAKGARNVIVGT